MFSNVANTNGCQCYNQGKSVYFFFC